MATGKLNRRIEFMQCEIYTTGGTNKRTRNLDCLVVDHEGASKVSNLACSTDAESHRPQRVPR